MVENGNLVDGTGRPAVPDAAVQVEDGLIRYAGPKAGAPAVAPEAARIATPGAGRSFLA